MSTEGEVDWYVEDICETGGETTVDTGNDSYKGFVFDGLGGASWVASRGSRQGGDHDVQH